MHGCVHHSALLYNILLIRPASSYRLHHRRWAASPVCVSFTLMVTHELYSQTVITVCTFVSPGLGASQPRESLSSIWMVNSALLICVCPFGRLLYFIWVMFSAIGRCRHALCKFGCFNQSPHQLHRICLQKQIKLMSRC